MRISRSCTGLYVTVASFCERKGTYVNVFSTWQIVHTVERRRLSACVIVGNAGALSRKLRHCADILPRDFRAAFLSRRARSIYRGRKSKERREQCTITYWHESASQESRCLTRASSSTRCRLVFLRERRRRGVYTNCTPRAKQCRSVADHTSHPRWYFHAMAKELWQTVSQTVFEKEIEMTRDDVETQSEFEFVDESIHDRCEPPRIWK